MALNEKSFTDIFDTTRTTSLHGFDENGTLKEYVANEPLFVYDQEGGGLNGACVSATQTNTLNQSDSTAYTAIGNPTPQGSVAGFNNVYGYADQNSSGNRQVYRTNAVVNIGENESAIVHFIVKMADGSEPVIGTSTVQTGKDIGFVTFNALRGEVVYKAPIADNAWHYIVRSNRGTSSGNYAGVIQYGSYTGKPFSAAVIAVMKSESWSPFFPFSNGTQTAAGATLYMLKGDTAEQFKDKALRIKGTVTPFSVSSASSDNSGGVFGYQVGFSASDRISFGIRLDGWHALVTSGSNVKAYYSQDFPTVPVYGQESSFELTYNDKGCSLTVDDAVATPAGVGDFTTGALRNTFVLGTRVSTDRILNCLIHDFSIEAT